MNLANTLFQKTAPSKEMPGDVFDELLQNAILEHGSDTDYYFKSKHGNYEVLFGTDGENVSVDAFGFKHNSGDWIEMEPNDAQFSEMKRKIDSVPDRRDNEETDEYRDPYYDNGVNRSDFY